ncbi:MAG: hypothetical protein RQ739_14375 [Desulfotignum sp.]|nr:hypothetical protein [Desulfotignum sp.]
MRPYFQHLHSANKYLLVLFGFSIPVSTALTNGVLGLLMLIACMTASPLQDNPEGWFFVFMTGFLFAGVNIRSTTAEKIKEQHI